MAFTMEMPRYRSHKLVSALEITAVILHEHVVHLKGRQVPYQLEPEMFSRYKPFPGDYLVQYESGYRSFSPRKEFVDGYTPEGAPPPPDARDTEIERLRFILKMCQPGASGVDLGNGETIALFLKVDGQSFDDIKKALKNG